MAAALGHNAHRFSIEWSRIEPERAHFDRAAMDHYVRMVAALRDAAWSRWSRCTTSATAVVEQDGGWLNAETIRRFERFVRTVVEEPSAGRPVVVHHQRADGLRHAELPVRPLSAGPSQPARDGGRRRKPAARACPGVLHHQRHRSRCAGWPRQTPDQPEDGLPRADQPLRSPHRVGLLQRGIRRRADDRDADAPPPHRRGARLLARSTGSG